MEEALLVRILLALMEIIFNKGNIVHMVITGGQLVQEMKDHSVLEMINYLTEDQSAQFELLLHLVKDYQAQEESIHQVRAEIDLSVLDEIDIVPGETYP